MDIVIGIVVGLVALMVLVVVHELGHFWMARRSGVEVEEFGVGFAPRAIAWRKVGGKWRRIPRAEWDRPKGEGTVLSLNWLPIGGFCKMRGESDADGRKGSFGAASFWGKTKILFGGVMMNFLAAAVILTVLAWVGMPHFMSGQFGVGGDTTVSAKPVVVETVMEGSPAAEAGLQAGDEIVRMDKTEIVVPEDVILFDDGHAGETIELVYVRGGEEAATDVALNEAGGEYVLGVNMSQDGMALYRSTWSAPIVGVVTTVQLTGETFRGLGQMLWNLVSGVAMQVNFDSDVRGEGAENLEAAGEAVSGPVGILGMIFPAFVSAGVVNLLFLVAIISISLACMNVLPIPALDGGRWLLIAIYKLRRKKLTTEIEERIVGRAFVVLLGLIVVITVIDVTRFFR